MSNTVTYTLDEAAIREVVDEECPDLPDEAAQRAVTDILSAAQGICLASLAAHVVEQTSIDLADYEAAHYAFEERKATE